MGLTALLLAAAQLGAQVGDWRVVMIASDGTTTLIDGASIRRAGSLITFWQKDHHPDGTTEGARIRLDCQANTWQIIYQQITDPKGRVVSTLTNRLKPQKIRPGSAMEEERARVCPVLVHN
jgi:hypothetical protein